LSSEDPRDVLMYALAVNKKLPEEAEKTIAIHPLYSVKYAKEVLHDRFLKGEQNIINDKNALSRYIDFLDSIEKLEEFYKDFPEIKRNVTSNLNLKSENLYVSEDNTEVKKPIDFNITDDVNSPEEVKTKEGKIYKKVKKETNLGSDLAIKKIAFNVELLEKAKSMIEKGEEVPYFILQNIAEEPYYSYDLAKLLIEKGKEVDEIPEIILKSIAQSSECSYNFAKLLIEKGKEVTEIPEIILKGIADIPYFAYDFAELLLEKGKDVKEIPEIIVKSLVQISDYSYNFVKLLIEKGKEVTEIPEIMIKGIAQSLKYSYDFVELLLIEIGKEIDEIPEDIIYSIFSDEEYRKKFLNLLKKYALTRRIYNKNENSEEQVKKKLD